MAMIDEINRAHMPFLEFSSANTRLSSRQFSVLIVAATVTIFVQLREKRNMPGRGRDK